MGRRLGGASSLCRGCPVAYPGKYGPERRLGGGLELNEAGQVCHGPPLLGRGGAQGLEDAPQLVNVAAAGEPWAPQQQLCKEGAWHGERTCLIQGTYIIHDNYAIHGLLDAQLLFCGVEWAERCNITLQGGARPLCGIAEHRADDAVLSPASQASDRQHEPRVWMSDL